MVTVERLIEELQRFPKDLPVKYRDMTTDGVDGIDIDPDLCCIEEDEDGNEYIMLV